MIAALLSSILAVGLIYWSWRSRDRKMVASAGWFLALGSIFAWSRPVGAEFGVTYAIIAFMCLTWAAVLMGTDFSRDDAPIAARPYRSLAQPSGAALLKHAGLFLLSVPAAGVLAMMLSVALVLFLPWTLLTKLAVAILLYPVLWGGLSAWVGAQHSTVRPALIFTSLFLISGALLFI